MDLLLRLRREQEVIEGVLQVFKELLARLGRARAVNLAHLEGVLIVWRDYLCREHLDRVKNEILYLLEKIKSSLIPEMIDFHETITLKLTKLEEVIPRLRAGRANASRELVKIGEEFSWFLESYLRREKQIFTILEEEEMEKGESLVGSEAFSSPLADEKRARLDRITRIISEISLEYLGRNLPLGMYEEEKSDSGEILKGSESDELLEERGSDETLKESVSSSVEEETIPGSGLAAEDNKVVVGIEAEQIDNEERDICST